MIMKTPQSKTCGIHLKAVLREKFIAIQAYLKKQDENQINIINLHPKQLEKKRNEDPQG